MNIKLAAAVFVCATVLAPAISSAADDSDMDRSHPKTFVKDSVITTKVKAKLAAEHLGTLAHIGVDTDKDGVVYLKGTAETQEAVDKATSIARGVEGVTSVTSDVKVKSDR